ncbi:Hypothetical protein SCC1_1514 [Pectobacterium versatile]|uniref:Uncharacterized protein n=1 Tax=Pectobacterium parmentieri TaxID=1905730 RepID=A0A0H3I213_PECPM|nr:Hypothetical protein W5S_1643 [Pectobacterium parmentieri]ASN84953.1 Hypothetical protein SCC1_1514 [Pectobacterium versatile]
MTHRYINFMGPDFNKIAETKKSFTGFKKRMQMAHSNPKCNAKPPFLVPQIPSMVA